MRKAEIEIGGKPRTFYFGLGVVGETIDRLGVRADELEAYIDRNPIKAIPIYMYESLVFVERLQYKALSVSYVEFLTMFEEAGSLQGEAFMEWYKILNESRTKHVPKDEPQDPKEKKTRGRKSTGKET